MINEFNDKDQDIKKWKITTIFLLLVKMILYTAKVP